MKVEIINIFLNKRILDQSIDHFRTRWNILMEYSHDTSINDSSHIIIMLFPIKVQFHLQSHVSKHEWTLLSSLFLMRSLT